MKRLRRRVYTVKSVDGEYFQGYVGETPKFGPEGYGTVAIKKTLYEGVTLVGELRKIGKRCELEVDF